MKVWVIYRWLKRVKIFSKEDGGVGGVPGFGKYLVWRGGELVGSAAVSKPPGRRQAPPDFGFQINGSFFFPPISLCPSTAASFPSHLAT